MRHVQPADLVWLIERELTSQGVTSPRLVPADVVLTLPVQLKGVLASAHAARRQALRDALGDAHYRTWAEDQRTLEGRRQLERWRIKLATSGMPLTPDQAKDLLPILVEQQQRIAALPHPGAVAGAAARARARAEPTAESDAFLALERRIDAQADINAGSTMRCPMS